MRRLLKIPELLAWVLALLLLCGCGQKAPAAPAQVEAALTGAQEVTVSWSGVETADTFRLFRRSGGDQDFKYLCDVEGTAYRDTDLLPGETYTYLVKAFDGRQTSAGTESAALTMWAVPELTFVDCTDPGTVLLRWSETSAQRCRIYGSPDGVSWSLLGESSAADHVLSAPECAYIAVSGVHGSIETPKSEAVRLLTAPDMQSLSRLDRFTMALEFSPVPGAERYDIYRAETADGPYTLLGSSNEPVYYDLSGSEGSFYQVQAVSPVSRGPLSKAAVFGALPAYASVDVPVIMYHEFVTPEDFVDTALEFDEYAIWLEEFEADLIYLRDNGYTTITCQDLLDYLKGAGTLPDKPILLTIDDGKLGVYKNACPLLRRYGMTASLAVIGERIDEADSAPEERASSAAPYCTWEEIGEMAASGAMEIISHTYQRHRYAHSSGHQGANILPGETEDAFYQAAYRDLQELDRRLTASTGRGATALAYPYSIRSAAADRVWRSAGYQLLLGGDSLDVRPTMSNFFIQELGPNYHSTLLRRIPRMTGTPLSSYLRDIHDHDK